MVRNILLTASDFHWKVAYIACGLCIRQREQVEVNMKAIRES